MKRPLTLTLTLLASCCLADDKISPMTVFKVGKTYHQTMTMVQDVTTPAGAMQTTVVTDLSMKVTAGPTKDSKHIKTTYEAMKIKSGMGDKVTLNFDSADKEAASDPTKASLGSLVGKEIDLTLDKDNQVTAVAGLDKLTDNAMAKQMFNQDSLKEMMGQNMLMGAPDHPIAKGESWEFTKSVPNPMMSISTKGQYTYEADAMEDGNKLAIFAFQGKLSSSPPDEAAAKPAEEDPKAAQMKQMMLSMGLKLTDGKMKGKSYFDPALGFLRRAEIETEMTMSLKNPQSGEKMEMPTKQSITLKLTGVEDSK
jgi:hypothetical protein